MQYPQISCPRPFRLGNLSLKMCSDVHVDVDVALVLVIVARLLIQARLDMQPNLPDPDATLTSNVLRACTHH